MFCVPGMHLITTIQPSVNDDVVVLVLEHTTRVQNCPSNRNNAARSIHQQLPKSTDIRVRERVCVCVFGKGLVSFNVLDGLRPFLRQC